MNPMSISKSFLQTGALAGAVERAYGLARARCQLISATVRDVYLVVSGTARYVLYVYPHDRHRAGQIRAEWEFVAYLGSAGVPVAPAIPTGDGDCLLALPAPEGLRYGVLTPFVPGEHLRHRPGARAVEQYGRIVARIHLLADRMPGTLDRPANDVAAILDRSLRALANVAFDRPEDVAYLGEAAALLGDRVQRLPRTGPAYGLIHGDVIRANAQVADDGSVTVLDFDFCGVGWRAYDVASYLLTIRQTPREREFERAFLRGYAGVRPLAGSEAATLPTFEAVRAIFSLGVPAMHVDHWGRAYLYAFLDQELSRLRECMERL